MKITTIAVSYTRRFNLGNFNSVEVSCSTWARVDEDENEEACIMILRDKCREHVRQEYRNAREGSDPVDLFSINEVEVEQ